MILERGGVKVEVLCPQRGAGVALLDGRPLSPDDARTVASALRRAASRAEGDTRPVSEAVVHSTLEPAILDAGWTSKVLAQVLRSQFGVPDIWKLPRNRARELEQLARADAAKRHERPQVAHG